MLESQLQEAVAQFFAVALPWQAVAFHVPNEGKRGFVAQRAFKRGGGLKGIPDWGILFTGRNIWIELKTEKGRITDAQKAVHDRIVLAGGIVKVCRSLEEVEDFLIVLGIPLRASTRRSAA